MRFELCAVADACVIAIAASFSVKAPGFVFASGGARYREMVRQLFPLIVDNKLDLRTRDLRDYLCDPKLLSQEAKTLQLASADVLDNATSDFKLGGRSETTEARVEVSGVAVERAVHLRQLGNRLRIAGRLREAGEAFRRALIVLPHDAWLIFDFARLLRSQASAEADADLLARARAALRLSSMRADEDARLLALLGESLLEYNDVTRAERNFQRALELEPDTYRARLGLADVALRSGKLAHVINQYRDAAVATTEKALVAFASREADYYYRLNDDDDYLSSELRRINWLQTLSHMRRLAARITNASILIALVGPYLEFNNRQHGMGSGFILDSWPGCSVCLVPACWQNGASGPTNNYPKTNGTGERLAIPIAVRLVPSRIQSEIGNRQSAIFLGCRF